LCGKFHGEAFVLKGKYRANFGLFLQQIPGPRTPLSTTLYMQSSLVILSAARDPRYLRRITKHLSIFLRPSASGPSLRSG
jgi:hypothetical protein